MEINTKIMNKFLIILCLIAPSIWSNAQGVYEGTDPKGTISYFLPSTTINIEVEATQELFYAGPYAKYANKYLGINVKQEDYTTYSIIGVKMNSYMEADRNKRFSIDTKNKSAELSFLKLTKYGLVTSFENNVNSQESWELPTAKDSDFSKMGLNSNLTYKSTTLYSSKTKNNPYNNS